MLMRSRTGWGGGVLAAFGISLILTGCHPANVPTPRVIPVTADSLAEVRSLLDGYAKGLPVSSERENFGRLVESVREVNPAIAAWLGATLAEIDANPSRTQSLAKKAIARFDQEAMTPTPSQAVQ